MTTRARHVVFILLGVVALVFKRHYAGPYPDLMHDYGGNVAASFAVYFLMLAPSKARRTVAVALALAIVELFEVFDGFGVMSNTYDRTDLVANGAGVGLAWAVDVLAARVYPRCMSHRTLPVMVAGVLLPPWLGAAAACRATPAVPDETMSQVGGFSAGPHSAIRPALVTRSLPGITPAREQP